MHTDSFQARTAAHCRELSARIGSEHLKKKTSATSLPSKKRRYSFLPGRARRSNKTLAAIGITLPFDMRFLHSCGGAWAWRGTTCLSSPLLSLPDSDLSSASTCSGSACLSCDPPSGAGVGPPRGGPGPAALPDHRRFVIHAPPWWHRRRVAKAPS